MARKRKSRPTEATEAAEPVPTTEVPEAEPVEQEEPVEENPPVEEEVAGEEEEEPQEGEGEEGEEEEEEEEENDESNEQDEETTEKPSENVVSSNGGEAEEDEEELEEEPLEKLLEPFSKDQLTLLIKESVAKFPQISEIVNKLADADPSHRKIFVHGLGWESNSETITTEYSKYGEIEDCKVVMDKLTGKSKGYGFLLFKHRDGARRALKKPQKMIQGRLTSCQLASAGPVQAPPPTFVPPPVAAEPPASEYTQRKIYVTNVSAELDINKLVEFFSKFGEIEEGPLGLDKVTGKPRGFCLFVYKSIESAKKALEVPHKNFEGQVLHCQKAVDGPKHMKSGFFAHQNNPPPAQHRGGGSFHHAAKRGRFGGSGGGVGRSGGHLMAPSAGPGGVPNMGFNPGVAPAAIGQAVAALLATQGGMGIGNLLGGLGGGVNPAQGMMNQGGYGGQMQGGYGGQMQGGYGGQQQMGSRPPYMGRGR